MNERQGAPPTGHAGKGMDHMLIQYRVKSVYGIDRMYPADVEQARWWMLITGQKTMAPETMEALRQLTGCAYEQVI